MFVFSREGTERSLGGRSVLRHGPNFPKDADWLRVAGTRVMKALLANGTLEACPEDAPDLGQLDREAAAALLGAVKDPVRLARWLNAERRPTVLEALKAQAKRYPLPEAPSEAAPTTGPDESKEDDETAAEEPQSPTETSAQDPAEVKPPKPPKAEKPPKPPKAPKAGKNAPADAPPANPTAE